MFFSDGGETTDLQNNSHLNNSDLRVAMQTDAGSLYQQYQGVHRWLNAASVSAGATQSMAERMRIASSGEVLFDKTSTSVNVAGGYIDGGECIMTISNAGNTYLVRSTNTSTYTFYVSGAGQINAVQTSISAISDERLKENIVDLETGLSEVMSLKPRRFDWKENEGSNEKNVAGFIAQEVETVLPDLVGDFKHDDLDDAKSVKMGDMIPTLVKAIQEQQTQIEALQSEINNLKGE